MQLSHGTKRLLIISIVIIILALAANEGTKNSGLSAEKPLQKGIPYPYIPQDIDPSAMDESLGKVTPKSVVVPKPVVPRPLISAEAYLVANLDTGEIYSEHNSRTVFPIASLSKLVTTLVVLHNISPEQKITITEPMLEGYGEAGHLVLGETLTVSELLHPLLLESSNDAAEALALSYGYANFIQKMNEFTRGLGMTATSFKDASGISGGNASNAKDLLTLARYIYTNEKPLLELTREVTMALGTTTEHGSHTWKTINPFPLDPHFMGGKTGRTNEAKESMISLFRYVHEDISYPVAIIVLRSDFSVREKDSDYLFGQFMQKIDRR